MGLLSGKSALITGAGRGIGRAVAERFAAEGATLFLAVRNIEQGMLLAGELQAKHGIDCHALSCDVSDADSVKTLFRELFSHSKTLDVLVNNAGVLDDALIGMVTPAQVERTFASNSFSVLYCSQYAARMMQRAGGGSIINLASIIGRVGNAGQAVYGGSKAAVIGITQSLAKELAPQQIRVNAIAPGFIDTDMAHSLPDDKFQQRLQSIAMGRIGSADEVAKVALFLASELSSYVTGQVIGVDGGMLI
ncbi:MULTISPECIES: SDR family NAD(P)-dependent oxidoreductase [Aeromonas]|uniref:SDR family NAD(P)-dependent oxidoreductase n=1 Tax=Aeromonas TaxID=642 RepID=UPI0009BC22C7|nr:MULTISPECIES: SDR family NAD(P)-dependent oxidoreductase [Aeromonas]MCX4051007.1 SDR family NAD(P)-dependent oxidoreductase [Aeromonas caviae]MCX4110452.1 SDR family NAD(P)-dependent oxidoreductase [Aeromonas caviae]MDX7693825.1 SDR family NAD(P)-dependent oxidoreductase [Aeromonas caviae]MDX7706282.1 SDR family NAD(P)-dependent oxidoreductase [Aeromonas caviae]MDX7730710.1 SDR family NAD(P)-dependent oxidoreductase [Aeromonas caviae]